jgi:hypothetical protein
VVVFSLFSVAVLGNSAHQVCAVSERFSSDFAIRFLKKGVSSTPSTGSDGKERELKDLKTNTGTRDVPKDPKQERERKLKQEQEQEGKLKQLYSPLEQFPSLFSQLLLATEASAKKEIITKICSFPKEVFLFFNSLWSSFFF